MILNLALTRLCPLCGREVTVKRPGVLAGHGRAYGPGTCVASGLSYWRVLRYMRTAKPYAEWRRY